MEDNIRIIKSNVSKKPSPENILILKDSSISVDKERLKKLYDLYKRYKSEKRNFAHLKTADGEEAYKTLEQYCKYIRHEAYKISNNICELANLAVAICYELYPSDTKTFAWNVFGEGIIKNIEKNRQPHLFVPFKKDDGEIEFLGNKYHMYEINIMGEQEEEYDINIG